MRRSITVSLISLGLLTGCPEETATDADVDVSADAGAADVGDAGEEADARPGVDGGGQDVGVDAADASAPDAEADVGEPLEVTASNYCELTVEMFCGYYMRCGRIVAADMDECRATFTETCNGVYEPFYAGYAEAGALELSADGITACEAHLESVACEDQIFDLDGGCAGMWRGLQGQDEACAPGIGSFVCGEGTACVLGTNFCGTCEGGAAPGEACVPGEVRCEGGAQCLDGVCAARPTAGQACTDEGARCAPGASCQDGVCRGADIVAVGEACDQGRRCPYRADCIDGACVMAGLIGDDCAGRGCASGYCDGTTCQALRDPFKGCSENRECVSGSCTDGFCAPTVSECLATD